MKFLWNLPALDAAFAAVIIICSIGFTVCVAAIGIILKNEEIKELKSELAKAKRAESAAKLELTALRAMWREDVGNRFNTSDKSSAV